jgi:hypothetical protein
MAESNEARHGSLSFNGRLIFQALEMLVSRAGADRGFR